MENIVNKNINYREEKPYYIYIHTCPNNKCYVGLSRNPKQRWNNGKGYKNNKEFFDAINFYGWNNTTICYKKVYMNGKEEARVQ